MIAERDILGPLIARDGPRRRYRRRRPSRVEGPGALSMLLVALYAYGYRAVLSVLRAARRLFRALAKHKAIMKYERLSLLS